MATWSSNFLPTHFAHHQSSKWIAIMAVRARSRDHLCVSHRTSSDIAHQIMLTRARVHCDQSEPSRNARARHCSRASKRRCRRQITIAQCVCATLLARPKRRCDPIMNTRACVCANSSMTWSGNIGPFPGNRPVHIFFADSPDSFDEVVELFCCQGILRIHRSSRYARSSRMLAIRAHNLAHSSQLCEPSRNARARHCSRASKHRRDPSNIPRACMFANSSATSSDFPGHPLVISLLHFFFADPR